MAVFEVATKSESAPIHVIAYVSVFATLLVMSFVILCIKLNSWGQKTRNSQQRRVYVGSRTRQLSVQEPTIYVSPANLPPPPKYEAMAPPSYDEVVGVHYPSYPVQPITQPITHAMAQSSSDAAAQPANGTPAVVTVTNEERTSVSVRS